MEEQKKFMKQAIAMAHDNVHKINGGPFGAVVVKDGQVVGRGINQVTGTNDPTAHAEIVAIRDACNSLGVFQLEGCDIYTSCEPCPMCLAALYWAGISKLYYAATKEDAARADFKDAEIYGEFSLPKEQRKIPTIQLMHQEAVQVFDLWNNSRHKIPY